MFGSAPSSGVAWLLGGPRSNAVIYGNQIHVDPPSGIARVERTHLNREAVTGYSLGCEPQVRVHQGIRPEGAWDYAPISTIIGSRAPSGRNLCSVHPGFTPRALTFHRFAVVNREAVWRLL